MGVGASQQATRPDARDIQKELEHLGQQLRRAEGAGECSPEECALCLTTVETDVEHAQLVLCRHVFHRDCYEDFVRNKSACPICRGASACVLKPPAGSPPLQRRHASTPCPISEEVIA